MISSGLSLIKKHLRKSMHGRKSICICLFLGALLLNGCAGPTTFRVLDAETKEPIEGVVAIAMWKRTKGIGFTFTYTAKAVETESDADGFLRIPMRFGTFALQKPHLKIYKPGYVGWDSRLIYLGCSDKNPTIPVYEKRNNFRMKGQDIYLEPWKEEYTFMSHNSFIHTGIIGLTRAILEDSKYEEAIKYEIPFYIQERKTLRERR